jgi:hypothetical protein
MKFGVLYFFLKTSNMNSLYLIFIGICFTLGVMVTSNGNESNSNLKTVYEENKPKVEEQIKVEVKKDKSIGSWIYFEKQ